MACVAPSLLRISICVSRCHSSEAKLVTPKSKSLAEEVVYEDSVAQRYAGLLAAVICDGNPTAKREYEHMLAQERQRAKSFGTNRV